MQTTAVSIQWITNRNLDLLCYIGACVSGYLLLYLNLALGVTAIFLLWFWIISVDGPHVFGTLSRTYLDLEEWRDRSRLLLGSLLWFLAGPLSILTGLIVGDPFPYFLFLALAGLWAYWHVVRQHYGFLVLYQKKNGEPSGKANKVDYWIFYVLMLAPFGSFLLRHPEARFELGIGLSPGPLDRWFVLLMQIVVIAAIGLYGIKEVRRVRSGHPLNLPKNLFLLACVPLHLVLFLHPFISTRIDLRLVAPLVTFYHNIQYHGIVWFYNRNRYGGDPNGERFGPAGWVSRNFIAYYAAGILFTLIYRYSGWSFIGLEVPFAPGPNSISETGIGELFTVSDLAFAFWWGFALNHYYLDQKIWRLSKDKQLTNNLRVA